MKILETLDLIFSMAVSTLIIFVVYPLIITADLLSSALEYLTKHIKELSKNVRF